MVLSRLSKKRLREAFTMLSEEEARFEDADDLDISDNTDREIRALSNNHTLKDTDIRLFGKAFGRTVSAAAMFGVLMLTTTLVYGTVRLIKKLSMDDHVTYSILSADLFEDMEATSMVISKQKSPSFIPDGYTISRESFHPLSYEIAYENASGDRLVYSQNASTVIEYYNTEGVTYEEVSFDRFNGFYFENEEHFLIVTDGEYYYSLISDELDFEVLKEIVLSV